MLNPVIGWVIGWRREPGQELTSIFDRLLTFGDRPAAAVSEVDQVDHAQHQQAVRGKHQHDQAPRPVDYNRTITWL